MTNRHLLAWFLKLDFLEADKLRALYLHDKTSLDIVSLALLALTLNLRIELSSSHDLIVFSSTSLASEDSNLQAWSYIRNSSDNTLARNQRAYLI